MKKLISLILLVITMLNFSMVFAYSNDYYSANTTAFNMESEGFFNSKNYDSILYVDVVKTSLGDYYTYESLYTQKTLNQLNDVLLNSFKEISPTAYIENNYITTFSKYPAFKYSGSMNAVENYPYYFWDFVIFSDNYRYEIGIFSYDESYISSNEISSFINSFEIKDTTNICTLTVKNEDESLSSNNEQQPFWANYTAKDWIADILLTAVQCLFIPIIIRYVFKKKFNTNIAFWISLGNFIFTKLLWYFLLDISLDSSNIYAGWWYIFIAQAILSRKEKKKNATDVETNIESEREAETNMEQQEEDNSPIK